MTLSSSGPNGKSRLNRYQMGPLKIEICKELQSLVRQLHYKSDFSSHVDEADGASGNDKLHFALAGCKGR